MVANRVPNVFFDKGKENCARLQYCLCLFSDGIQPFVQQEFRTLHGQIANSLQNATGCTRKRGSCSKNEKDIKNWCYSCGAWRTSILGKHKHKALLRSKSLDWSKIDSSLWPTNECEVKKVFYPEWFFKSENCDDRDVSVLLVCMENCQIFTQPAATINKIRNTIVHANELSDDEVRTFCKDLCDFLGDKDICQIPEAVTSASHITILKDHTLSEIREQALIDEQILLNVEKRWYTKQLNQSGPCTFLVCIAAVFLGIMVGPFLKLSTCTQDCEKSDIYPGFRLDIESYVKDYRHFTGKEWLLKDIHSTLKCENRGIILISNPGYGKTAIISKIVDKTYKHTLIGFNMIHHHCSEDSTPLRSADAFILNIVYHLYKMYPDFKNYMASKEIDLSSKSAESILVMCKWDASYCARILLIEPLQKIKNQHKKLLLVVDSLDRCFKSKTSIVDVLILMQNATPNWIKFLLETRNDIETIRRFRNLKMWHLHISDDDNDKEFLSFLIIDSSSQVTHCLK